jgi:hypothetical protein
LASTSIAPRPGGTLEHRGYASLAVNGAYGFYRIDLLTGQAPWLGTFKKPIVDIAIPLNQ